MILKYYITVLIIALTVPSIKGQSYICDDTPENNNGVCECSADVCYFKFVIEHLQTFTAYEKNATMGSPGRVYYLDNHNLKPATKNRMVCEDLSECTETHTVDGSTYRSFFAINKRIPGPTLIVNNGATVVVDVFNFLVTEETSIHWHGMHQRKTPWMDGVGYISQCPIEAGGSFRYIFKAEPAGTFWYHSHSGAQRTDGLFGALIVRESEIPIPLPAFEDIPGNHTLTLLDWQREASLNLFVQIHSSLGYFENVNVDQVPTAANTLYVPSCSVDGAEIGPIPYWSGIINGKGKYKKISFSNIDLSTFNVESGKTYRFRLIGAQGNYAYKFSVDNHNLTLIATDGYFIVPVVVDYIIVHTGERYDFLLSASHATKTNFLMRAETLEVNCATLVRGSNLQYNDAIAVLTYDKSRVDYAAISNEYTSGKKTCNTQHVCKVANCPFKNYIPSSGFDCSNLHVQELTLLVPPPENQLPKPSEVTMGSTWFFNFGFDSTAFTSTVNGRNFILPTMSLQTQGDGGIKSELCKDLSDRCQPDEDDCECVHMISIGSNLSQRTVRFVFSSLNTTRDYSFAHPIHLHGHSFHVVKVGYGSYYSNGALKDSTKDLTCGVPCLKAPTWTDGITPYIPITNKTIQKDTVIVPAGGYVVVDFIADNPGYWFLHCHIEPHQLEGMALVINELESKQNPHPSGMHTCGNFNWTVEEFNKNLHSKPGSKKKSGLSYTGAILISTFLSLVFGLSCGYLIGYCCFGRSKRKKGGYIDMEQT